MFKTNTINKFKTVTTKNFSYDLKLFEYGGGFRVKFIKSTLDPNYSRCVEWFDEFFPFLATATDWYNKFVNLLELVELIQGA